MVIDYHDFSCWLRIFPLTGQAVDMSVLFVITWPWSSHTMSWQGVETRRQGNEKDITTWKQEVLVIRLTVSETVVGKRKQQLEN